MSQKGAARVTSLDNATLLIASSVAVTVAVGLGLDVDGVQAIPSIGLVVFAALLLAIVLRQPVNAPPGPGGPWTRWARVAIVCHGVLLCALLGGTALRHTGPFMAGGVVVVGLVVLGLALELARAVPRILPRRLPWPLVLVAGGLGLLWLTAASTGIDVEMFQRLGVDRLFAGENPYRPGYPDIYPPEASALFYGPGLAVDGELRFGFPYPPLSLLLVLPAHLVGEVRLAHLVAVLATALLMMRIGNGSQPSRVAAALVLTSPATYLVIQHAWTEPLLLLGLAATGAFLVGQRAGLPAVLGLTMAVKQYAVVLLPVLTVVGMARWPWRRRWRVLAVAGVVAAAVTVPLALWHWPSFLDSVVSLHLRQPFRADALSLLALSVNLTGWPPDSLMSISTLLAVTATIGWVVWRAPRTLWAMFVGSGLVIFGFVILSKQAGVNYYFLQLGLMYLGLASLGHGDEETERAA